jgi:hypothetical protein
MRDYEMVTIIKNLDTGELKEVHRLPEGSRGRIDGWDWMVNNGDHKIYFAGPRWVHMATAKLSARGDRHYE